MPNMERGRKVGLRRRLGLPIPDRPPQIKIDPKEIASIAQVVPNRDSATPVREFPTQVANLFHFNPVGNYPRSGVTTPIAARPNSAPMLEDSMLHSNIPGIGRLLGVASRPFMRGTLDIHPAAVSDVEHVISGRIHPTTKRKVLMGDKSL